MKIRSFLTGFALLCLVAILSLLVILLIKNKSLKAQQSSFNEIISEKEEEISLCLEDVAKIISVKTINYSFDEVGIYSDLFEQKSVDIITYYYLRNEIKHKHITNLLENNNGNSGIEVEVWEFEKRNNLAPISENEKYLSIFNISADYGRRPKLLFDMMADWDYENGSFKNKHDVEFYWVSETNVRGDISFRLESYQVSRQGRPIFIIIKSASWFNSENQLEINQVKTEIKTLANSISLR